MADAERVGGRGCGADPGLGVTDAVSRPSPFARPAAFAASGYMVASSAAADLCSTNCRELSHGNHPIQILRANSAAFMNRDALNSPIVPTKSHRARIPKSANTTNKGNETRLNLPIDVKPAGPPLSAR